MRNASAMNRASIGNATAFPPPLWEARERGKPRHGFGAYPPLQLSPQGGRADCARGEYLLLIVTSLTTGTARRVRLIASSRSQRSPLREVSPCHNNSSRVSVANSKFRSALPWRTLRAPLSNAKTCIACKLCERICPAQAITIEQVPRRNDATRPPCATISTWGKCIYCACARGLSGRCHRRDRISNSRRDARGTLLDKAKLLANGDRWERELAKSIELDAPYR